MKDKTLTTDAADSDSGDGESVRSPPVDAGSTPPVDPQLAAIHAEAVRQQSVHTRFDADLYRRKQDA